MKYRRSRIKGELLSFKFKLKHLTGRSDDNGDVADIDIAIGSDGHGDEDPTNIYLSRVDVDPKWQRHGLCKMLLTYCLKMAYRELRKVYGLRFTDVKLSGNVEIFTETKAHFYAARECYIESFKNIGFNVVYVGEIEMTEPSNWYSQIIIFEEGEEQSESKAGPEVEIPVFGDHFLRNIGGRKRKTRKKRRKKRRKKKINRTHGGRRKKKGGMNTIDNTPAERQSTPSPVTSISPDYIPTREPSIASNTDANIEDFEPIPPEIQEGIAAQALTEALNRQNLINVQNNQPPFIMSSMNDSTILSRAYRPNFHVPPVPPVPPATTPSGNGDTKNRRRVNIPTKYESKYRNQPRQTGGKKIRKKRKKKRTKKGGMRWKRRPRITRKKRKVKKRKEEERRDRRMIRQGDDGVYGKFMHGDAPEGAWGEQKARLFGWRKELGDDYALVVRNTDKSVIHPNAWEYVFWDGTNHKIKIKRNKNGELLKSIPSPLDDVDVITLNFIGEKK